MEEGIAPIAIGAIWVFFLLTWTIPSARKRQPHMVFASFVLASFLTLAVVAIWGMWDSKSPAWLKVAGWIVQLVGAVLLANSFHYLSTKGRPLDKGEPTIVVDSGVYRLTRHPMYLGMGTWALGIALVQFSTGAALIAAFCVVFSWLAAIKEDQYNLKRFGEPYAEYMRRVPLASLPGLRRRP